MTRAGGTAHPDAARRSTSVVIVGGGSAGYIAALTIQRLAPAAVVTILDPSSIPTIGVGESTTSEMPPFLHLVLGADIDRFYREVQPTIKLGIKFVWGLPGDYAFNYPFDRGDLQGAHRYDGHFGNATLGTMLMSADRVPVLDLAGEQHLSLLDHQPYGYHIDNARFLAFLRGLAAERGIRIVDRAVRDFVPTPDGRISALTFEDGSTEAFDLYVDCSGFRRAMLGRALGIPFISFRDSLLCDRAVTGTLPHGGKIKPYTTAETMPNGWLWNIPQRDRDHVGYVFSSAYCDVDQARRELERHAPEIAFERDIKFESGRLEYWVSGNVLAIGNAYAFVEPLESTALFVMVRQCLLAARNIQAIVSGDPGTIGRLNTVIASIWDYLRWFLSIHYRFNRRLDSPFWKECRASVDISGATGILDRYQVGPDDRVGAEPGGLRTNFDAFGYEALLLGQGVKIRRPQARLDRASHQGDVSKRQLLVDAAMPQDEALIMLEQAQARALVAHVSSDPSWLGRFKAQLDDVR